MIDLTEVQNLLQAHEDLVFALEDFVNNMLNEKFYQDLIKRFRESQRLIQLSERKEK